MGDETLSQIMARIRTVYPVVTTEVAAGGKRLRFLMLEDEDRILEELAEQGEDGRDEWPYWSRIWPAAVILAHVVARIPSVVSLNTLEIAAGPGVAGLFAAAGGHRVTVTDNEPTALDFVRAERLLNGLTGLDVRPLDWSAPQVEQAYDLILSADPFYRRDLWPRLPGLFLKALVPGGAVLLTTQPNPYLPKFLEILKRDFSWSEKPMTMRGPDESHPIMLFTIKRRV